MNACYIGNAIAPDVHSSTICGGGAATSENVIGGIAANVGTAWTGEVYASGASLRVAATGEVAKDIQWVARVEFTENIG